MDVVALRNKLCLLHLSSFLFSASSRAKNGRGHALRNVLKIKDSRLNFCRLSEVMHLSIVTILSKNLINVFIHKGGVRLQMQLGAVMYLQDSGELSQRGLRSP